MSSSKSPRINSKQIDFIDDSHIQIDQLTSLIQFIDIMRDPSGDISKQKIMELMAALFNSNARVLNELVNELVKEEYKYVLLLLLDTLKKYHEKLLTAVDDCLKELKLESERVELEITRLDLLRDIERQKPYDIEEPHTYVVLEAAREKETAKIKKIATISQVLTHLKTELSFPRMLKEKNTATELKTYQVSIAKALQYAKSEKIAESLKSFPREKKISSWSCIDKKPKGTGSLALEFAINVFCSFFQNGIRRTIAEIKIARSNGSVFFFKPLPIVTEKFIDRTKKYTINI